VSTERLAIFEISPHMLAGLLNLPEGAVVDAIEAPIDAVGTFRVRIRGAGWLTQPGEQIRRVRATISRFPGHANPVIHYEWPLDNGR